MEMLYSEVSEMLLISCYNQHLMKECMDLFKATLREANRHQELPLARIKKIMKLDDDVKHQVKGKFIFQLSVQVHF